MTPTLGKIARAYRVAYSGLPPATWLACFVTLVNRSGAMVLPFLLLYLTRERGVAPDVAGLMLSGYGAGGIVGSLGGGWLVDRVGSARVLAWSLVATGAGYVFIGVLAQPFAIGVALAVTGLVSDAHRPAASTLVAESCPREMRAKAFALYRLAINAGVAIGPAIGGFLAKVDYFLLFSANGATSVLAAGFTWLFFVRRRRDARAAAAGMPAGALPDLADTAPWHDRVFLACLVLVLATTCILLQFLSTLTLHLNRAYGLDEDQIGLLLAINPVLIVLFEMVLVDRLRRSNPLRLVGIGSLLTGVGFGLIGFGTSPWWAAFSIVVWTAGEMLDAALMGGYIANRAGERHRGAYMGLYMLTFSLAFLLAPALGTLVYDRVGPAALWWGCIALGAVICAAYQRLARRG